MDVDHVRYLPPERTRRPHCGRVGAHDRSAHRAHGAIHVGMRVRGDHERAREYVAVLDHDLVTDPASGGIEVDAVLPGEGFNV